MTNEQPELKPHQIRALLDVALVALQSSANLDVVELLDEAGIDLSTAITAWNSWGEKADE